MSEPGPENPILFLADGTPDWNDIEFDVLCSRCGYNLRTLTRPMCPECGLEFEWQWVLDRAAHRSDFLFEHQWQSRPFRSWIVTVWRSFWPKKFWSSISLHDRIEPQPLVFMMLLAVICFSLALHGLPYLLHLLLKGALNGLGVLHTTGRGRMGAALSNKWWTLADGLDLFAKQPVVEGWSYIVSMLAMPTGLILISFGVIGGLRQTLGRCRVRTAQVLRVIAYAATPICLAIPLMALFIIFVIFFSGESGIVLAIAAIVVGYSSVVLIPGYYFSSGLKHYLHLPRPRILGFTAAFVAALAVATGGIFIVAMFGGPQ